MNFREQPFDPVIYVSNFMLGRWLIMYKPHEFHIKVNLLMEFVPLLVKIVRIGSQRSRLKPKGQLVSECLLDVLNFPKNQRKNLTNFCPRI